MPRLSVIILNYDGRQWLPACLDAMRSQRNAPDFETVVVDNGSTDESVAIVRRDYPWVRLLESPTNRGFAGGNNFGVSEAHAEWLIFLNNDTVPDPHWLHRLWEASAAHPGYSLLASRLVFLHDPSIVDSAGDGYLRAGGAFKHGHGADADAFADTREVFGACGGALMIRRSAFEALGGFDERFFMQYEDVDLSYRARLRGMRALYVADAIVRHAGSGSLGTLSPAAVYYGQRNLEWTWIKNTPGRLLLRTAIPHAIYSLAGVLHYVKQGRGGPALRAKLDALRALPSVLADRRRVQAERRVSVGDLVRWMEPRWLAAKRREKAFTSSRRS